jgi:hypothetical protein
VLELELELELVAAPRSASVPRPEAGPGAAAVTVGVTVVGPAAAAGPGVDPEFEPVPAESGPPLPVVAAPGDSTAASNCPAPDMAARTPSGAGVVAPVALVEAEAVLGVGVAFGVALPHMRYFGLGWRVGRQRDHLAASACTQPGHLGTCHILPGHMRLCSMHRSAAGRLVDHNRVVAVREHATRRVGTQTALVGKAGAVVHKLPMYQC